MDLHELHVTATRPAFLINFMTQAFVYSVGINTVPRLHGVQEETFILHFIFIYLADAFIQTWLTNEETQAKAFFFYN